MPFPPPDDGGYHYRCNVQPLGLLFQGSGLPLSFIGAWPDSMHKAHIALQKILAVALELGRMACHLSGDMGGLDLDNSTAKAYLCSQGTTISLSRLAYNI